jgi:hypothetical protein
MSIGSVTRWTVEIVCTDRGQHKRNWITRFIWDDWGDGWRWHYVFPGGWGDAPKHDMYGPPERDAEPGSAISRKSDGFACSRCNRWPKIKRDRWIEIMDAAHNASISEFDVSYLD